MSEERDQTEPTEESLAEIPEISEEALSRAVKPNLYANLRGSYRHAVFVDPAVWEHFGSEERILEALRLLVSIAKKQPA